MQDGGAGRGEQGKLPARRRGETGARSGSGAWVEEGEETSGGVTQEEGTRLGEETVGAGSWVGLGPCLDER